MGNHICAVDVGTGSARAGIFTLDGRLKSRATRPITLIRPDGGLAEQDSENIWKAVCAVVSQAVAEAGLAAGDIAGIGFDATCSLVMRGTEGEPLPVSPGAPANLDTICWMDHRAVAEAAECTASGHEVLDSLGGVMSPEMQTPKLMWLKRHNRENWARAGHIFDLADFLTWRATGSNARSLCTVTSKWTYRADAGGWQKDFFESVGLDDLFARSAANGAIVAPGNAIGTLSEQAAAELGLTTACVVAAGLVDAFAGGLGTIGGHAGEGVDRHLALIAGTSSCVMAIAREPRPASGLWGPYFGAALPGYWVSEGGQSATGALLDHVIVQFGGGQMPDQRAHDRIARRIEELLAENGGVLAPDLHVLPDFHGNRTPHGDSAPAGVISGLALDSSFDGLCALYWRTCVAIVLGVRQILEHMNANGFAIDTLHLTGGHARSRLLPALYAEVTGCAISLRDGVDAMLLGSATNAASAAGLHPSLADACRAMAGATRTLAPDGKPAGRFDRDYRIFKRLREQRRELLSIA